MDELISRQAAIDALKTDMASLDHIIKGMSAYDVRLDAYVSQRNQVNCDIDTISNLPPAQPERKTAYWTKDIVGSVVCSNCGGIREDNRIGHTQWCNCCGCFMRGEQE